MNGKIALSQVEKSAFSMLQEEGGQSASLAAMLAYKGVSIACLGRMLGVSGSMASKIVTGREVPKARVEQMAEIGFPKELLPPAGYQVREEPDAEAA